MMDDELNSFEIKSEPLYDPDPLEVDPLAPRPSDYLHAEEGAPSVSLFHFKPVRLEDERKPSIINENLDSNDEDISPVKREPGVTEFKIENGWNPSTFDEDHIPNNENNFPKKRKVDAKEFDEDSSSSSVICVENSIKIEEESSGYSNQDWSNAAELLEDNTTDTVGFTTSDTTARHSLEKVRKNNVTKLAQRYTCNMCDYKTHSKNFVMMHLQTIHHISKPLGRKLKTDTNTIPFGMAGNICCFRGCFNTRRKNDSLKMFRIPKKSGQEWLPILDNPDLIGLTQEELYSKRVCQIHFKPEDVDRGLLKSGVLPMRKPDPRKNPPRTYPPKRLTV